MSQPPSTPQAASGAQAPPESATRAHDAVDHGLDELVPVVPAQPVVTVEPQEPREPAPPVLRPAPAPPTANVTQPLPVSASPDFAEAMRRLDVVGPTALPQMRAILDDPSQPYQQRFSALYFILHRYERSHSRELYEELCKRHRKEFGSEPYFDTFMATIQRRHGSPAALKTALTLSERAIQTLSDRPGVLHQHAIIAADLLDVAPEQGRDVATLALKSVDTAIRLSDHPNPNFHSTRARLLSHLGDFTAASSEIEIALELEDTTSPDSLRRIARFEATRSSIQAMKSERQIKDIVRASERELSSLRGEQLQLLGILAAVVALIMVSVSTGARISSDVGAIRFTLIALGGILALFVGLFFAIQGARSPWRVILPLAIASALFAFGIWGDALL